MKLGYQGMEGSNARAAAEQLAARLGAEQREYVPLISSRNVVRALLESRVDGGVMALENRLGGPVEETIRALEGQPLRLADRVDLPIHHCVFIRAEADPAQLERVVSHIQALRQTVRTRRELLPRCREQEAADTAMAAVDLSEGRLDDRTAVLCRREAGEACPNLRLLYENVEDSPDNVTSFGLFVRTEKPAQGV